MESLLGFVGTWFGYVGSCLVAPDATCRPFLAFFALGAAASAALTLILMAYRSAQTRQASDIEGRRTRLRASAAQERVRRAVAGRALITRPPVPAALP